MDLSHADWRKASYSSNNGGACVEVARNLHGIVAVRDSKNPAGAPLVVSPDQWTSFIASLRAAA
jgi:hypothetical protein